VIQRLFKNPKLVVSDKNFSIPNINDYSFAKDVAILPLGSQEIPEASKTYPILFAKDVQENIVPVAIMGLRKDRNLFVNDQGEYVQFAYIPALFRIYPFGLAQNNEKYSLVVDQWALEHYPSSVDLFFDHEGNPSKRAQGIIDSVRTVFSDIENTKKALRVLSEKNLVKQMDISVEMGEEKFSFKEFFVVDENRLRTLPEKELGKLYKSGVLTMAIFHNSSLGNFKRLGSMYGKR
jgi:hypothetical protein